MAYDIPITISPSQSQRTRNLGVGLAQQGLQYQPVLHPLQALGQLAQTAAGAFLMNKADRQEQERRDQANQALMQLMGLPTSGSLAGVPQAASAGGASPPPAGSDLGALATTTGTPGGMDMASIMATMNAFPELAPILQPMIAAQTTATKPLVLSEGEVAYDPRTGEEIVRGREARAEFETDLGKAMADAKLAKETFGEDSEQAKAFADLIQSERSGAGEINLTDEAGQRKEFTRASGDFVKVRDAFGKIQKARPTAAGDLAMIFNYMKLLDPGSVVREGEFATAQNTAGVPERVRNTYNRLLSGERLSPEQRTNFKAQAGDIFVAQRDQQNLLEAEFDRIAAASGLRPKNVIVDFQGELRDFKPPETTKEQETPASPVMPSGEAPAIGGMGGDFGSDTDLLNADLTKMTPAQRDAWEAEMDRRGL